jgi:hypothetical protein
VPGGVHDFYGELKVTRGHRVQARITPPLAFDPAELDKELCKVTLADPDLGIPSRKPISRKCNRDTDRVVQPALPGLYQQASLIVLSRDFHVR